MAKSSSLEKNSKTVNTARLTIKCSKSQNLLKHILWHDETRQQKNLVSGPKNGANFSLIDK